MRLLLFSLVLALGACNASDSAPEAPPEVTILETEQAEDVEPPSRPVRTASGASFITIDYKGTLKDGTVFDDADGVYVPLAAMPPGFIEGVIGMREGETRRFEVPPALGYGDHPPEGIPEGATLRYEVTLHRVR